MAKSKGDESKEESREVAAVKVPPSQIVDLNEYCHLRGLFKNWANAFALYCQKCKKLFPKTVVEWDNLLDEFKKKPA